MKIKRTSKGEKGNLASGRGHWLSEDELSQLKRNLIEAQETLEAIQSGAVDAVVVNGPHGSQIYSLTGAEQPYRVYVERMQEGAVTISSEGFILYANRRFAEMVNKPLEQVIGTDVKTYLDAAPCKRILGVIAGQNDAVK
ncbi:MAG: PAS domain-containing protein, partial [Limisphaerales bacterium]